MVFTRMLVRSLPRLTCRNWSSRTSNVRSISRRHTSVLTPSRWTQALGPHFAATFSSSRRCQEKEGEIDEELSAKVQSELQLEMEMKERDEVPLVVQDYVENGPFQLHDEDGSEEVTLTRAFGDESIRVVFSISDLADMDQDADKYDDKALYDEEDEDGSSIPEEGQSGGAQSKSVVNAGRTKNNNIKVAPEDSVSPTDRDELAEDEDGEDGEDDPSVPIRLEVTVTKPGQGALQFDAMANDGMIIIDNVYHYADASLANTKSADRELARQHLYLGPPFANLDEDLQVLFERYLDERGINTSLALFIPDYVDYKEQKEYLRWLNNVKLFVDA